MARTEAPNSLDLPVFRKERYSDPAYLGQCRHFASWALLHFKANPDPVAAWIQSQGTEKDGVRRGLLFDEEIGMMLEHGIMLPWPWTPEMCRERCPENYESINDLSNVIVPDLALSGARVGMVSGVFDVLHAGHVLFLKKCREQCDYLVVGVDDNELVGRFKGEGRPINDFAVRAGTLTELPYVSAVHRIPSLFAHSEKNPLPPYGMPYTVWLYELPDRQQIYTDMQIDRMLPLLKERDPEWYGKIAPNITFFISENDYAGDTKRRAAKIMGANLAVLPRQTEVSTTLLETHFGLRKQEPQPDKFGVPAKWQRWMEDVAKLL